MCPAEEEIKDQNSQGVAVEEAPKGAAAEEGGAASAPTGDDSVKKAEFQDVVKGPQKGDKPSMDLLMNVTLPVAVELGRVTMTIQEVLGIYEGSVIELERVAGEPVDILVSGKLLGKGEVVVVDDKFGIRITELINRVEGIEQ
jgi:flagellar motor switch protein FliN/FliY